MLGVAPPQQAVPAHVQPVVGAVVAQHFRVFRAPSVGQVPQRLHQQVAAEGGPLQVGPEVGATQGHLTPQAGFHRQRRLRLLGVGGAAVARHPPALLLALGADEATPAFRRVAPGLADAGGTEAVAAGQRVGLAEDIPAHRAGQLRLQGRHGNQANAENSLEQTIAHHMQRRRSLILVQNRRK